MTPESLQPTQGFANTSSGSFVNVSSDGFANTSSDGLLPPDSNTSLLENKMRGVATASDAKKHFLDPSSSIDPTLTSLKYQTVVDGDTLKNKLTGEKSRITQGEEDTGFRFNPWEVKHGDKFDATAAARILDQRKAIAKINGLPLDYIPDSAVYGRGENAKRVFGDLLKETGDFNLVKTGKIDIHDRPVTEIFAPGSDQSLVAPMNTEELNADYNSRHNITGRGINVLKKAAEREEATKYSVSDANRETLLGGAVNLVAGGAVAASDQIYNMAKSPFELLGQFTEHGITNKQRELSAALTTKQEAAGKTGTTYTPTAEEQAILETPAQTFMRENLRPVLNGERNISAKDLMAGLNTVDPLQQSIHEKLQETAFVKENITDKLTAMQEGNRRLYNSAGSDELYKESKGLYNDSVEPTFVEGVQKFKKGHVVDGSLQMVDAIANAGAGILRVGANNKQAVAEEAGKQIINSFAASKALLATALGMYTNTDSEITDNFVKENGRYPEGREVDNIHAASFLSAMADSYTDKWLTSKPGIALAIPREFITEAGQNFLEQDAAKQGASKIDRGEVFASGTIGALAAGGHSVITSPEAAIIEAAQGVGNIAGGAISGAKKAAPTIQWAAQALGDAGREYGNVLPDGLAEGMSDATKAGLAKLTGALTGMPTDSLGSGLKAAGSLAAHATKEGAKAVGGAVGDYLDSAFPISSQAIKDFKASNLVPDKISNAVDAAKQEVTDAVDEVNSSTATPMPMADVLKQASETKDPRQTLKTMLQTGNSPAADTTPEDRKAFVDLATEHNTALVTTALDMGKQDKSGMSEAERQTVVDKQGELLAEFRKNKETIDGIKAFNPEADTTDTDLSIVAKATTPELANHPDTLQAIDRTIRSMRQPNKVSIEQAESLQAKATLTPEQTSVVSAFIATQTAKNELKSMSKVGDEVIYGQKAENGKKGFLGMVEHQAIIADALDQNNIPAAQSALDGFKSFAASQAKKAASLTAMSVAAKAEKFSEVKALDKQFKEDFPTFQPLNNQASTAFLNLANTVGKEADMLTNAVAEAELHIKLGTTEAKAVPVNQEASIITPVGTDNAKLTSSLDSNTTQASGTEQGSDTSIDTGLESALVVDPVINNTTAEQVTTDTSGNAEEESITDPVAKVADATEETTADTTSEGLGKVRSIAEAIAKYYGLPEFSNIFIGDRTAPSGNKSRAWYTHDTANGHSLGLSSEIVSALSSPDARLQAAALETLHHELGHHAAVSLYASASPEVRAAVDADYAKFVEESKTRTPRESIAARNTIIRGQAVRDRVRDPSLPPLTKEQNDYIAGYSIDFQEWLADEGAKYLLDPTSIAKLNPHTQGLIQKIAAYLQELIGKFSKEYAVGGEGVKAFYKELEDRRVLARIKELSKTKNLTKAPPFLIAVIDYIVTSNTSKDYSYKQNNHTISVLEALPDKATNLGTQSLDSTRKFLTGKKLSDYYITKVLDKVSKYSALITTPNFFSTLKDAGVKEALGLTPEQLNGLAALTTFVDKFAETFKEDTFTADREPFSEGLSRNPAFYFMKEKGRDPFDENFVSTLATVAYSWVVNNANNLIQHNDEGINRLLGRDSKSKVSDQERELLSDKQILKSALITSLGKEIVSSLGLTFNTKADGSVESKMVEALGIYAVNTLDHMGILNKSVAIHKNIFLAMKNGKPIPEVKTPATGQNAIYFTGVATTVTPVKDKSYSNTELSEKVQKLVDDNRTSKGLLTELFDYKQQRALPLLVAPTLKDVPKRIKRGIKRIPERVRKALHKYNSNAFTINMGNHTVLDFLEREQQLRIFKYNENLEGVHDVNIKSVQGTNRTAKNELEAYHQLVEHLKLQPEGMSTPMYFMSSVWKSGRAGMEGLINPQASKFFRHMIGMASWESTIDSPEKLELFKIAVAEALGSKVDRQSNETSLEAFDRLRNQPEIRDGVASIKYLNSGVEFSAEQKLAAQEDILAAIEKGGSEMYTLEALTALATYSETESFTTRMTKEVDGVTNGVIIGLIQLGGYRPKELLEFLKAGGLSEDPNFVYGEWVAKNGSMDNYQRIAATLVKYMTTFRKELDAKDKSGIAKEFTTKERGDRDTLDGIEFFIGDLGTANELTKAARDLAKNPVMITNFGSAMKNVVEGLGMGTVENFYSMLEDARDNQVALDKISKQLNKILKLEIPHKILKASYLLDVEDTNENEALKFKLSKNETEKFQKLVATSIGSGMSHSITEHFQPFIDKRKGLNNAMTLVHAAFMIKYDAAYKAARDLKGSNLSKEEVNALVKTLEPSMASFDHAMSDGEMDTELLVASNESKTVLIPDPKRPGEFIPDPAYTVQVNAKKNLPHGPKSVTAHGSVSYFGFPGVGSVIKAIHSSDGAVQYKLMETSSVLNVHDADVSGIDGAMVMAQRQNLAFKEMNEDYSMRASIQKSLLRAMKELTPAEVKQVEALLQITNDKAEGFLGHDFVRAEGEGKSRKTVAKYKTIDAFVTEFTDTTKIDLAAKKALLASIKTWVQYNLNHGGYVVDEDSEAFFATLEEMESSLEQEDAAINAMMKEEIAQMKKAERNRISGKIKSSATEDIDIANFVADSLPITISASTVNSIFDELGKLDNVTDPTSHTENLRTVLNQSIRQVLNPMELLVRKLGQTNSGVLSKGKIYLNLGNAARLHTTDQSAQEVYVHELVHAVTAAALASNYWLRKQARSLYEKVQDQITPESFLDYDGQGNIIVPAGSTEEQTIAKAKAVYDHIFDNNDIAKLSYTNPITNEIVPIQYSNGLLEFVAMGTTNAKFIKILAGINTNKSKRDPLTYADRVYNVFIGAINSVLSLINKTKDPAANVALMKLMHKLANANQVKSNIIMRKFEENGHLEDIVNSKLYKALAYSALTSSQLLKARKNKTLSAVGNMIGLSQDTSFEAYKKVAGKLARRHGNSHRTILSQLVTEAEGITAISSAYLHMLSKSNMLIDQLRRLQAQSVTNQILGSFIVGMPSKSEGIAITKVMLKTDMSSLIDHGYAWDKMFGLLKSKSKLATEIKSVEQQLQAAAPSNFDYYKTQAATLGYMMVNGQPLKWGTKINAVNIAHLGGTGKTIEGDLAAIEKYVDILASLHAIKYSDKDHVKDFVTVAEREFAKDKDNNGVMLSYLVHKDLKARALEESFEGQKELMFKGYTKEIYNPRVSIEVAPDNAYLDLKVDKLGNVISTETKMKAKGYIKVRGAMSKDPTDLNKEPMSLYVNKDGDTATFNKMGVSLTSNRRKGHDLGAGYSSMGVINPALLGSWDTAHATSKGQKILASADYADLSKIDNNNLLVPVENAQHEIVGYRYLMNEATKDDLLDKENGFAKVLGAMEGSIVDKRNSKQINNEVVNLMREDFLANYEKDPDLFIKFSSHSQNADDRELYAMLPADMRKEIKRVWGSDVMYVRANMFRAIFGFRKFTVTEGSKEEDEANAMHEGVLTNFRIALRDKLRTPTAKKGEIALQEIAKEVKDAIVIKLGGTLYNNIISNNWLLWVKGVGRFSIVKDQAMFLDAARQYHKDVAKLMELERSVRINPKLQNSANVKAKINSLKDHMAHNPISFLMDSGVSQTIIEDVDTDESQYTYKGMLEEKLAPLVARVPKPLKTLASIAYMNHDTKLYKFMREATQLSDLVARATLHKHNIEKKGMSAVDSINDIKDTFIDYAAPTSKQIQYLNDTNFLSFTKFFIRSQKIIYQTYAHAPARALSLLGFEDVFGELSTINDSNIINTSLLGRINNPVAMATDLVVPHTFGLIPTGTGGGSYIPE
jgi:hypothetical protein